MPTNNEFDDYSVNHSDDIEECLEDYHRQLRRETLSGPTISFVFHTALLILLCIFVVKEVIEEVQEVQVSIEELEIQEPEEPPIPEELPDKQSEEQTPKMEEPVVPETDSADSAPKKPAFTESPPGWRSFLDGSPIPLISLVFLADGCF